MLSDNVFSAALGSCELKRSIPPHLPWWYFYVNLANITRKPENASHSKKKRSIRSSLSKQASLKALSLIFCKIEKRSHATLPGVLIQCIAAFHWSVHFLLIRKHFWDLNFSCRSLAIFNCTLKRPQFELVVPLLCFVAVSPLLPPPFPPFPPAVTWHCVSTIKQLVSSKKYSEPLLQQNCRKRTRHLKRMIGKQASSNFLLNFQTSSCTKVVN